MLKSFCDVRNLLGEGVCMVEMITEFRQPLPVLDAIYFISPTAQNMQQLVEDACGGPGKNRSKYKSFHICLTHRLTHEVMQAIASSPDAVRRIDSFAEVNLGFSAHNEKVFHFADESVFKRLLSADLSLIDLSTTADRLATVFASLGVLQPIIRYQNGKGDTARDRDSSSLAWRLALELQMRLSEISMKGPMFQQDRPPAMPITLIILDRGNDWPALLEHDFHYEGVAHDLLGGTSANAHMGKKQDRGYGDENDELWKAFRFVPIWDVNEMLAQENAKYVVQDQEMAKKTTAATDASNLATMVANAVDILQNLPHHKGRGRLLSLHGDVVVQLNDIIQKERLVDIGMLEQEMLTSIDHNSNHCRPRYLEKQLVKVLDDPGIKPEIKLRLLMLYCATENQLEETGQDAHKIKGFARYLPDAQRSIATCTRWLSACGLPPETSAQSATRRKYYKEKAKANYLCGTSSRLTRWEPKLRDVIEKAAMGELSYNLFPEWAAQERTKGIAHKDVQAGTSKSASDSGLVIVFVAGGITLSEARQAYEVSEVSEALGIQALVGGNCVVSSAMLMEEIQHIVGAEEASGSSVAQGIDGAAADMTSRVESAADSSK